MAVMLPCLTIWPTPLAFSVAPSLARRQADFTFTRLSPPLIDSLFLRDIVSGLVKSVMFRITITAVGCLEGLFQLGAGANRLARSTTRRRGYVHFYALSR